MNLIKPELIKSPVWPIRIKRNSQMHKIYNI